MASRILNGSNGGQSRLRQVQLTTVISPQDYVIYRRRFLRQLGEDRMNDWVDPDFYTAETLTDIISRPTRLWHPPPLRFHTQLLAIQIARANAASNPLVASKVTMMLLHLEKLAIDNVKHQGVKPAHTNLLRRLPAELLMDVAELLDPADFISLRASCKWAYKVANPLLEKMIRDTILDKGRTKKLTRYIDPETSATWTLRDHIVLRFHCDRFSQLAHSEVLFRTLYGEETAKLLCSFCMDFHPAAAFSSAELAKSPERMCAGAAADFRLCEHRRLSFKDMINLCQRCKVPGQGSKKRFIICTKGRCAPETAFSPRITGSYFGETLVFQQRFPLPETRVGTVRDYKDTTASRLSQGVSSSSKDVNKLPFSLKDTEFRDSLVALDEYICPHLRTSSPEVFQVLVHCNKAHCTVYWKLQTPEKWLEHATAKCSTPGCGAMFFLEQGDLVLGVKRPVTVRLITDPEWVAKVDIEPTRAQKGARSCSGPSSKGWRLGDTQRPIKPLRRLRR